MTYAFRRPEPFVFARTKLEIAPGAVLRDNQRTKGHKTTLYLTNLDKERNIQYRLSLPTGLPIDGSISAHNGKGKLTALESVKVRIEISQKFAKSIGANDQQLCVRVWARYVDWESGDWENVDLMLVGLPKQEKNEVENGNNNKMAQGAGDADQAHDSPLNKATNEPNKFEFENKEHDHETVPFTTVAETKSSQESSQQLQVMTEETTVVAAMGESWGDDRELLLAASTVLIGIAQDLLLKAQGQSTAQLCFLDGDRIDELGWANLIQLVAAEYEKQQEYNEWAV